jgi:hypothetical protein
MRHRLERRGSGIRRPWSVCAIQRCAFAAHTFPCRPDSSPTARYRLLAPRTSWHRLDSLPTPHRPDSSPTAQCPFLAPSRSLHQLDSLPTWHRSDCSPTPQCLFLAPQARLSRHHRLCLDHRQSQQQQPVLMRVPFAFWNALAGVAEMLPQPPLTRNQVELMQIDTTASANVPGFRALGISPRSLEDELEAILRQNRPRVSSP